MQHTTRSRRRPIVLGSVLVLGVLMAAAAQADEEECERLWTIGGAGSDPPWVRTDGYRIGMTKSEAQQIRAGGNRNSLAQDHWTLILSVARVLMDFEKGRLVSATVILESFDYQTAYTDVMEQMGPPQDFGKDYLLWRSPECNTIKILKQEGDNVVLAIQSIDRPEKKKKKGKKGS